ncbi:hypothetical protein ABPG75_002726 [Micractinium tetrahymenae]
MPAIDVKRDRRLPVGVVLRVIARAPQPPGAANPADRQAAMYQEIRWGNQLYKVEGEFMPTFEMEGLVKRRLRTINSHPLNDCALGTIHSVRHGRFLLSRCGECGKRDGAFILGMLTGCGALLAALFLTASQSHNGSSAAAKGGRSWWQRW